MAPRKKVLLSKVCETCGKTYYQKRYSSGPDNTFKNRRFCSRKCFGQSIRVSEDIKKRRRKTVIVAYGGKCVCCGESDWHFLTLDHINNDGAEHRKKIGQSRLYIWAEQNNYPSTLQVLCFNCNMAKGLYGICPHKKDLDE